MVLPELTEILGLFVAIPLINISPLAELVRFALIVTTPPSISIYPATDNAAFKSIFAVLVVLPILKEPALTEKFR